MKLNLLKEKRLNKKITQKQMANLLDIQKSTYCRKENGIIVFKLEEVKLIKEYLELDMNDVCKIFL